MLIRLFGKNFRSLKAPFELSLVAADLTRPEDQTRGVIKVPLDGTNEPLHLLRVVAIYGHNGSGKSTVLTAANALRWLIRSSSRYGEPGSSIPPYEPFLLDSANREASVTLGCDVVHQRAVLRYEVCYRQKIIESERLTLIEGGGAETPLIDRHLKSPIRGMLIEQSESNQLYVKEMQPNVTVLAKLAQHGPSKGPDSVRPYHLSLVKSLRHVDFCTHASGAMPVGFDNQREQFASDEKYRQWIMNHLMLEADVGIKDVKTSREDAKYPEFIRKLASSGNEMTLPEQEVIVSFIHRGRDSREIEFDLESAGTKKLFGLAEHWWRLAHKETCLFADELSASLHPRLLDALVRGVNDSSSGRVPSQLIFATHDAGLMESRDGKAAALRRDQIYFTSKDDEGASELYALAEFKDSARPVHNLRKRYLSGVYGAVPTVEELPL